MKTFTFTDISPSQKRTIEGVVIESYPLNPACRSFHSRKPIEHRRGNFMGCFMLEYPQDAMIQDCELIAKLLMIQGIAKTSLLGRYEIALEKAEAFEWDEIEPQIIAVIRDYNEMVPAVVEDAP